MIKFLVALLVAMGALIGLILWLPEEEKAPEAPGQPSSAASPYEDFGSYAQRMRDSDNQYYGTKQIPVLESDFNSPDPRTRFKAIYLAGMNNLRFNEVEKAISYFEQALGMANDRKLRGYLHERIAVAHLRRGELANCVALHGSESCIMPFSAAAQHQERDGSEKAIEHFMKALELLPEQENVLARWLLTVAHGTLGTEPPKRWAIPFPKSEFDIGRFRNIAPQAGINGANHAGAGIMDDFDGDGRLDIIVTDSHPDCGMHYWHNDGNGRFTDWVERAGLADQRGGLNCIQGDYDNDGRLDLLILRGGWMNEAGHFRVSLLRNRPDGKFEDVTVAVGLADVIYPTNSAVWIDYDGDADLDLFVASESHPSRLYRNDKARFTNVAREAGVENGGFTKRWPYGYAKGVSAADYDNDGDPDLYITNYLQPGEPDQPNRLYRNNGDGTFTDVARELGVTEPPETFACFWFDYDNDGWPDLFATGYSRLGEVTFQDLLGLPTKGERPRLYRNVKGKFEDVTRAAGLYHVWQPMGCNFGDLDNDGWLDVYLGTGFAEVSSLDPSIMLRNSAGKRFQNVTVSGGFGHLQKGHGIGWGDIDNDGDEDVFAQIGGVYPGDDFQSALYLNPGHGKNHVTIRLVGRENSFGFGAKIKVRTATREMHRTVGSGSSFGGNSIEEHVGLGDEKVESVEVTWPWKRGTQLFTNVPTNAAVVLHEGRDEVKVVERPKVVFGR